MDWIERIFHVSPDGGSGITEVLLFGGVILTSAAVAFRRLRAKAHK